MNRDGIHPSAAHRPGNWARDLDFGGGAGLSLLSCILDLLIVSIGNAPVGCPSIFLFGTLLY